MSDIKRARDIIEDVLAQSILSGWAANQLQSALKLMVRRPPVKRVRAVQPRIDRTVRAEVRRLAAMGLSNHEIANQTGLRNQGRVSEILTGKR